ncbi:TolC family protein [Tateyamaria pelophila]|uniref:TolC family protein n=1 Tax=Tateyamaria pelophila TaxID=328415 RepID=UPI001CBDF2C9|nr:TolC family protein [Tateyamaria pelophila]
MSTLLALGACSDTFDGLSDDELTSTVAQMTRMDVRSVENNQGVARQSPVNVQGGFLKAVSASVPTNPAVEASVRTFQEANERITVAKSGIRPQLTASGLLGASKELTGPGTEDTGLTGTVTLQQLVYDGGLTAARIDGSTARAFAAQADVSTVANEAALDAANAWIDVWQYNARLRLLRNRLADLEPLISRIETLISSGMVDRASLASAQRQVLDIKLEEEQLIAAQKQASVQFQRYFGVAPGNVAQPNQLFAGQELGNLRALWRDSPALISAGAQLIAAETEVKEAQAARRPTVSLQTAVNAPVQADEETELTAGLFLEYTFSDGGRRKAEVKARQAQLEASRSIFEDNKEEAEELLEAALANHRSLQQSMGVLNDQVAALKIETDTTKSQLQSGQSSLRDVVEAEVLLYRAMSRKIQTQAELVAIEFEMGANTGQLLPKLQLSLNDFLQQS